MGPLIEVVSAARVWHRQLQHALLMESAGADRSGPTGEWHSWLHCACCKLPHSAPTCVMQPLTFLAIDTSAKLPYPRSLAFSWRRASVFSMIGVLSVSPEDALVR